MPRQAAFAWLRALTWKRREGCLPHATWQTFLEAALPRRGDRGRTGLGPGDLTSRSVVANYGVPRCHNSRVARRMSLRRKGEDSCSWSVQKRASRHFDGETSHGARATADKSSNRCVVNETSDEQAAKDDLSPGERAGRRRRVRALAVVAVALAGLVGLGWLERRSVRHSFTVLGHAHLSLISAAISAEILSMATLARLQRRLLRAGGVRLSITSMVAIIYASNAISASIPVAGTPMSAAFSFRSFARRGADRGLAGWVLTISGLISAVTFALIVAGGAILTGNAVAAVAGALAASATVVPVLLCLIALRDDRLRPRLESVVARGLPIGPTRSAPTPG